MAQVGYELPQYQPGNQPPQGAVIVQQPAKTVITQQVQVTRPWSSGTCDCFDELKSCLFSFLFGNCYYACVASRMGENCCVGLSGYPSGCVPGGHFAMRSRFRGTHNIEGDICGDCFITACCLPCSMCQISREMDHLGYAQNC